LLLAVPVCVLPALLDRVLRGAIQVLPAAEVSLRDLEDLLLTLVPRYRGRRTWHESLSLCAVGKDLAQLLGVGPRDQVRLPKPPLPLPCLLREDVALVGPHPLELARARLLDALGRTAVRLHLRHDLSVLLCAEPS